MLEPDGDQLKITLKGDLAGMLERGQRQQEVARYRRRKAESLDWVTRNSLEAAVGENRWRASD